MTCHRRYLFATALEHGHKEATAVVETAVARHWWFREPMVSTEGALTIQFVVSARDQWWAHRRATELVVNAVYAAGGFEGDVPIPEWTNLPPHTNRGYGRTSSSGS